MACYIFATVRGLYLSRYPQTPFNLLHKEALIAEGGKYVKTKDGRIVEYFVKGSPKSDAKVVVTIHGQLMTGKGALKLTPDEFIEGHNLKVIAVSMPGCGYSDAQMGRKIVNWPKDDLEPILAKEGVDKFIITGTSYGTAHALAAGVHFEAKKCLGVGISAGYVPYDVCIENGVTPNVVIPRLWFYNSIIGAWIYTLIDLIFPLLCNGTRYIPESKAFFNEGDEEIFDILLEDMTRSGIRGRAQHLYDIALDVSNIFGFDPQDVQTKNMSVWYASDDSQIPEDNGKWLCDIFRAKKDVKLDARCEKIGYGHLTFWRRPKRNMEQIEVLLKLVGEDAWQTEKELISSHESVSLTEKQAWLQAFS